MLVPSAAELIKLTADAFAERFGRRPRFAALAPGRVNLIGEHTDYNEGYALPMAIDRWAAIVADRTDGGESTLWAIDLDEVATADLTGSGQPAPESFANYLLGVADRFAAAGQPSPNLDLAVRSTIPMGAGLASSGAVEVAMATLLEAIVDTRLDPLEKALLCQRAEREFAGTPCGIMDMFVAIHAQPGCALLLDCRTNTAKAAPLPPTKEVAILMADTGLHRGLAQSAYADRRAACERAAARIGVPSLRDADLPAVEAAGLGEAESRVARHVILENQRVLLAAAALSTGDLDALGELMFDSHASLRDL